jgi:hypothetical protein
MAYDEDGYYRDENAQKQFRGAMSEAIGAAIDGRYQLMPRTFRGILSDNLENYSKNQLDLSTRPLRGAHQKKATLEKQAELHCLIKLARKERMEKEANPQWWNQFGNQVGQGWGQLFNNQTGMLSGLPGPQWMYPTALGAGAGYFIGDRLGVNPWGAALMAGGLSYLANNWAKNQYDGSVDSGNSGLTGQTKGKSTSK